MQGFKAAFASDGTDWDFIPYDMLTYGGGGIGGWGTLCGIANGCPALCNLIGLHGALGSDILGHYSSTEWPPASLADIYWDDDPTYGPSSAGYSGIWSAAKTPIPDDEVLAKVIPYSPLCHISISKWCYAAGVNLGSPNPYGFTHKNDRCGKIAAEMAGYTAELINYYALNGASADPYAIPAATADCLTCHYTGSNPNIAPAQITKMDCAECHAVTPDAVHQGLRMIVESVWTADGSGTPKNTFTSGDPIQYKVRFHLLGAGFSFVKTADSKVKDSAAVKMLKLIKSDTLVAATYEWTFSDTIDPTDALGTAKVVMKLKCFDYQGGNLLDKQEMKYKFTIV
ncbi:MAG: hypothetical protein SWH78_06985 [Thermodesulfobacteriota bacterium]|nr:hypothetical protein [Thermodesulfobacteriota bacterium]